jgi:cation transport ATPase
MTRAALIGHISIPALVTLGAFAVAVRREPFGMEMFSAYVLGGYLFYAAPHLLWAVAAAVAKASRAVWHAGFIASSIALAAVASLWLGPQDPSGLPLQWMLYWPLALILLFVFVGGTAIYQRAKKTPNPSINTDAAR